MSFSCPAGPRQSHRTHSTAGDPPPVRARAFGPFGTRDRVNWPMRTSLVRPDAVPNRTRYQAMTTPLADKTDVPTARDDATIPPADATTDRDRDRAKPLPLDDLYRLCPVADLGFATTAGVPDVDEIVGQDRAVEAIDLSITTPSRGFNVFALGPPGIGKTTAIRQFLARRAAGVATPDDWCYVHNFADPQRPQALRLPAGTGASLRESMAQLCVELQGAIPAAFESEGYRRRKEAIEAEIEARREAGLAVLEQHAKASGVALVRTPLGLGFAPTRDGEVVDAEAFQHLPEPEQQRVREAISQLESELQAALHQLPQWQRETRRRLRELDREVVQTAVDHLVDELRHRFGDLPSVVDYL